MEDEIINEKGEIPIGSQATVECPAIWNTLQVSMFCCQLDEPLTFLWGNSSFFSLTGYPMEEYCRLFCGMKQYYADDHGEFAAIRQELLKAKKNNSTSIKMTVRLPLKNRGFSWVRLMGTIKRENPLTGEIFLAELVDVDELVAQKEEQARLHRQKEQYFQWMMESYAGNVYVSDMDTHELLYVNQNAYTTLNTTPEAALGKKCFEIIQGRTSPCPFCTNDRLSEEEFYDWEFYNEALKQSFMIKNRCINWKGHRARIELSYGMNSTEYMLQKKDREREVMSRSIPGGFARLDARDFSTILWYSADFLSLIGYTAEQFKEELHSQCTYVHPEDLKRVVPLLTEIKSSGESVVTEVRIITRSGRKRIITLTLTYASKEDSWDGIPSFYSVGIDVTKERLEQERQKQALEDAYQSARIANAAKSDFLSSMSHDIRTPMNAIMGMSAIAQANLNSPAKIQDCLGKINASSRHLLNLVNEVLDMSKIESGKIELAVEKVSLPELFQDVMDTCRPLADQKHQEFLVRVDHVHHENVLTDGGRLQLVMMNLLSNAVKYTPDGGKVGLLIRELPALRKNKGQFEFIVADNGIGMTEEFIPHIFEPFARAEDSRISKIQGTGLGMAITENVIHMMNGTIEVRSTLGEGSRFIITVSFELCEEEAALDLAGLSVLIVDDDQVVCESVSELLDDLKIKSTWILSGKEAVHCILEAHKKSADYSALILDWMMPDLDGLNLVKEIRENLGVDAPIIIISAYDYSDVEEDYRKSGADAFISKPLFKSKIVHALLQFRQRRHSDLSVASEEKTDSVLEGKHILVVEDNELNREIVVELLQMQGLLVDIAENGLYAVEKFRASEPGFYDAVLMDVQMPVMDGYEAAETIRKMNREDAGQIPIFALTANAFSSDIGKAYVAGMNEHIAKPIDIERLMEALKKWLC